MPIYEYECRKCGAFEVSQSINDAPLQRCPECRSKVTKLISATSFHLKGGGWYADGYSEKAADSKESKDTPASKDAGSGNGQAADKGADKPKTKEKSASKSESKPAAKKGKAGSSSTSSSS